MPLGSAADLDFMLADCGSAVIYGDVSTFGLFRRKGSLITDQGMNMIVDETTLGVRYGVLDAVADSLVTVDTSSVSGVVVNEDFLIVDAPKPGPDGLQWLVLRPRGT